MGATDFWSETKDYIALVLNMIANESRRSFISVTNVQTGYTWWSDRAVEFFGIGDNCHRFATEKTTVQIHPDDLPRYRDGFRARMAGRELGESLEYRIRVAESEYILFSAVSNMIYDKSGAPLLMVTLIDNHGIADEIDFVTGLHNEYAFDKYLTIRKNVELPLSMMKISLGRFSRINMMYGSDFANRVLRHVASELVGCVGKDVKIYRFTGSKFIMIFDDETVERLQEIYQAITDVLAQKIEIDGKKVPLEISGGAMRLRRYDGDENAVKSRMTYLVERSRQFHHGMLEVFDDETDSASDGNLELVSLIHSCAVSGCQGFFMRYQPIVKPETGEIMGMEALLRWKQEPYGEIAPGVFIEWLEEDPCIYDLGNWIIENALRDAALIAKESPGFFVNVNISAGQIKRKEFREAILERLKNSGLPPAQFCMELTERCREMDLDYLSSEIEFFKSQGIKVAMDDFGTGSASLSMALAIPVDELKIDMSFVKNIADRPGNQQMVRSIVEYGKNSNIETCIEGVESQEVRDYLDRYGATWYQGYYYSSPVSAEEMLDLLKRKKRDLEL